MEYGKGPKKKKNVNFFKIGLDPPSLPPQNVNFLKSILDFLSICQKIDLIKCKLLEKVYILNFWGWDPSLTNLIQLTKKCTWAYILQVRLSTNLKGKNIYFFQMLPGWAGWAPVYVLNIDPDHGLHHSSNTRLLEALCRSEGSIPEKSNQGCQEKWEIR